MALSNRDRVGKALDLLQEGLRPFVEREMMAEYGNQWLTQAAYSVRNLDPSNPHFDVQALLLIIWDHWNAVFNTILGHTERSLVSELREWRNKWAHQEPFSTDDAYRALDSAARLLTAIAAPEQAQDLEHEKQDLLRVRFAEQARQQRRRATATPIAGQPLGGLRPWREVITPHPDVASGRYSQAEFAADLAAVHRRDSGLALEYADPVEFFRRTFLTEGLRLLIRTALLRLSGQGGDPVVDLQTNFGGGKTHSMLALYHLVSGQPMTRLPGLESLLEETGVTKLPTVHPVVLVGTALGPGDVRTKPDGIRVHTLWGELAWQLGGAQAYARVAEADRHGVNPGSDALYDLFTAFGPALILIDEWVALLRQLYNKHDALPAGSFDANLTFAQSLTEAVKRAPRTLLVASLPASDIEIGGEGGREALARLRNTFGRTESPWRPASAEESFEIVRRRLFQPLTAENAPQRDAVVESFLHMYREQPQEFPFTCQEADYKRRMQLSYPIHPELFERLYNDWSSLEKFQRTRGVLRLMAAVIHTLWERNDAGLLILPSSVPLDESTVQAELLRYLEDHWAPVLDQDVDGPNSLPLRLDRENPNLGRYSATRRVARAIFMGSAPTFRANNPGLDTRNIKLGCVQPGEAAATFGDALRRLADEATHLYVNRNRYWFSTQPSVNRLAQDRAAALDRETVWEELRRRLRAERRRGELAGIHAAPSSSADIPDDQSVRLVILDPSHPHARLDTDSPALTTARMYLDSRGNSPRLYKNMLVFLVADRNRLSELEEAVRQYLAWLSICGEGDALNLDTFQRNQAQTRREQAEETIGARLLETYCWLLVPYQTEPRDAASLTWDSHRLQGQEPLAERVSRRLIANEAMITRFAPLRLRMEVDRLKLWEERDHISLKDLWEYCTRYLYMPRLKDIQVLFQAVADGISMTTWQDHFAYASGWDEQGRRYLGLQAGGAASIHLDGLLVRPEAARRQLQAEQAASLVVDDGGRGAGPPGKVIRDGERAGEAAERIRVQPQPRRQRRRFYGSVKLDPLRVGRDAGVIADEVIRHLVALTGTEVQVTLEIQVRLADDAPEHVVRTVTENARTLGFTDFGFEDE